MEIKALILNITPYGPKDEKGIGMNSIIQYIPLDKRSMKDTEKSKGYYISFNKLYNKSQKSFFQNFKTDDILTPVTIVLDSTNTKYADVLEIVI